LKQGEDNTDSLYPDAKELGQQDARDMITKKKPRTISDLVTIKKILGTRVNEKYGDYTKGCRIAYRIGVEEELKKYLSKLRSKQTENPYL
jgi:hypothetical protein